MNGGSPGERGFDRFNPFSRYFGPLFPAELENAGWLAQAHRKESLRRVSTLMQSPQTYSPALKETDGGLPPYDGLIPYSPPGRGAGL